MSAVRIDDPLLREIAIVADPHLRDEMAGPSYLHWMPLVRWLFWKRLDVVARFLEARRTAHTAGLDFGCGLGLLLPTLAATTRVVYATDLVLPPARQLASRLGLDNVTFVDPTHLDREVPSSSVDYVVSTDVLEHVDDLPRTLDLLRSRLKPGGRLVISGPTENVLYKAGRVLAGFGGKGGYHHTDIHRIHEEVIRSGAFTIRDHAVLPLPHVVEAFHIYAYQQER